MTENPTFVVFRLLDVSGLGPAKVNSILHSIGKLGISISKAASEEEVMCRLISPKQMAQFKKDEEELREKWNDITRKNIRAISVLDKAYPQILKERLRGGTPPLLFVQGNLEILQCNSLGFCGSRDASERGLKAAQACATVAARHNLSVISGYAAGVDMTSHASALENNGNTVVVLAEGISRFRIKKDLARIWDWDRCLVVSEFLPRIPWSISNAMRRNYTICGLSTAMILIEAGETGGSFEAGKAALSMGVPLFAPVYEGMPRKAVGNQMLLEQGAHPLLRNKTTLEPNFTSVLKSVREGLCSGVHPMPLFN